MRGAQYYRDLKKSLEGIAKTALKWAKSFDDSSRKYWKRNLWFRLPIIILGISLTYIVTLQSAYPNFILGLFSSIVALVVSVLTALDAFFQYGKLSVDFKSSVAALQNLFLKTSAEIDRIHFGVEGLRIKHEDGVKMFEDAIANYNRELQTIFGQVTEDVIERYKEAITTPSTSSIKSDQ